MLITGFNSISGVIKIRCLIRTQFLRYAPFHPVFHFENGARCTEGRRTCLGNKTLTLKESSRISSCNFINYN